MPEDRLNSLLSVWQQQQLQGRDVPADELCRECPELAEELGQRIDILRQMNVLIQPGDATSGPGALARVPKAGTDNGQSELHPLPADQAVDSAAQRPMTPSSGQTTAQAGQRSGSSKCGAQAQERQTIGRFQLQKLLGEGGFAQVYLAYDPALDRKVAIKVPREDTQLSGLLRREAMVAAKLKHPGIAQIYEICPNSSSGPQLSSDPAVYVVMQFIEGANLAKKLEAEKVSLDYTVDLMLDVTQALAFAHGQGVLHRDLKPHNILLDVNDRPYVADFGLAIRQDTLAQHLGEGCGTPAYMSPEQAAGGSLTAASDLWSMGVILYELLVAQRPFGSHPLEVFRRVGKEDPVPPRQLDRAVSFGK